MNASEPEKSRLELARDGVFSALGELENACYELGYDRGFNAGWDAAMRRFTAAMEDKPEPQSDKAALPDAKATPDADVSAKDRVLAVIRDKPGLRGIEIVEALGLNERSVRTVLHRLKTAEQIRSEEGKWFANEVPAVGRT